MSTGVSEIDDDKAHLREMMILEVNYGKGRGDILVHFGDDPADLANKFVNEHGLKPSSIPAIAKHISSTIEAFQLNNAEMQLQDPAIEDTECTDSYSPIDFSTGSAGAFSQQPPKEMPHHAPSSSISSSTQEKDHIIDDVNVFKYNNESDQHTSRNSNSSTPTKTSPTKADMVFTDKQKEIQQQKLRGINSPKRNSEVEKKENSTTTVQERIISDNSNRCEESIYDKLKRDNSHANAAIKNSRNNDTTANISNNSRSRSNLQQNVSFGANLVPSSSNLCLSSSVQPVTVKTNATVSERLYGCAMASQQRKTLVVAKAEKEKQNTQNDSKFKLNAKSKEIMRSQSYRSKAEAADNISQRLYEDGVRIMKQKHVQEHEPTHFSEWLCSRCGTSHMSPMHALNNYHCDRVCSNCNFDQSTVADFHPSLENSRGVESSSLGRRYINDAEDIYEYLYTDHRNQDKKMNILRSMRVSIDNSHSFQPAISGKSKDIVKDKITANNKEKIKTQSITAATTTTADTAAAGGGGGGTTDATTDTTTAIDTTAGATASVAKVENKENVKAAGKALDIGDYFQIPASERLYKHNLKTPRRAIVVDTDSNTIVKPIKEIQEHVDKLTYEYRKKEARRQKATVQSCRFDQKTGRPLFQPHPREVHTSKLGAAATTIGGGVGGSGIPSNASVVSGLSDELVNQKRIATDGSKLDVFNYLVKAHKEKVRRIEMDDKARQEYEKIEFTKGLASALPQSEAILREATDRSIEEMFRLLVASEKYYKSGGARSDNEVQDAESICAISKSIEDWDSQRLDLSLIQPDMLIAEVKVLVLDVIVERLKQIDKVAITVPFADATDPTTPAVTLIVNFRTFTDLVMKCLRRRNGTGKAYIYAPKKRPQVTLKMMQEERQQETFHPVIDKMSTSLSRKKNRSAGGKANMPIEEVLIEEGKRTREKAEQERVRLEKEKHAAYTFQPTLFPIPKHVTPKYRNQQLQQEEEDLDLSVASVLQEEVTPQVDTMPSPPPPAQTQSPNRSVKSKVDTHAAASAKKLSNAVYSSSGSNTGNERYSDRNNSNSSLLNSSACSSSSRHCSPPPLPFQLLGVRASNGTADRDSYASSQSSSDTVVRV